MHFIPKALLAAVVSALIYMAGSNILHNNQRTFGRYQTAEQSTKLEEQQFTIGMACAMKVYYLEFFERAKTNELQMFAIPPDQWEARARALCGRQTTNSVELASSIIGTNPGIIEGKQIHDCIILGGSDNMIGDNSHHIILINGHGITVTNTTYKMIIQLDDSSIYQVPITPSTWTNIYDGLIEEASQKEVMNNEPLSLQSHHN